MMITRPLIAACWSASSARMSSQSWRLRLRKVSATVKWSFTAAHARSTVRQHLAALTPAQKAARAAVRPTPRSDVDASGPSRLGASTLPAPQAARLAAAASNAPAGSLVTVQGTPIFASSALSRSALGSEKPIFLRVAVTPNAAVRYKTTLQVPSDMYLADVLEMICRKRQLASPDEWALIVPDKKIVAPLDRTVESLEGNHDLALVKRSSLGAQGGAGALTAQSTNPSGELPAGRMALQLLMRRPQRPSSSVSRSPGSRGTTRPRMWRRRTRCVQPGPACSPVPALSLTSLALRARAPVSPTRSTARCPCLSGATNAR